MKKAVYSILTLLIGATTLLHAQTGDVPRLEKRSVGATDAKTYLIKGTPDFEMSLSEDQSEVYVTETQHGDHTFGAIIVRFVPPMSEQTPEDMENLLVSYLDYLKQQFGITGAVGYGHGHTKDKVPDARGIIDYWEDADGLKYAVKGWVNQSFLAVLCIYGPDDYPIFNIQDMYLNGFRFPNE